jgi:hypothetical protein
MSKRQHVPLHPEAGNGPPPRKSLRGSNPGDHLNQEFHGALLRLLLFGIGDTV